MANLKTKRRRSKKATSFDGAKINYEVSLPTKNKDLCIVFVHGLGGDLTAWDAERDFFHSEGVPSIAIDLRGHGFSDRSEDKDFYKMINFSKDIVEVMKKEGFQKYTIVGHCFGGMVSMILEANYPKTAKNLILVDTGYKPPLLIDPIRKNPFLIWMLEILVKSLPNFKLDGHADFNKYINTPDFDLRRLASDILHVSIRSYLLISENLFGYDATKLLDKITIPTLVVEGKKDTVFPPEIAKKLNERIKKSEIDYIDGANHILVISNPLDLSREFERFLIKHKFI